MKPYSELTQEDKLRLVTGVGNWHTYDCEGKLPAIHLSDGPHGLRKQEENEVENNKSEVATCFPTASCSACSWDLPLLQKMGAGIAAEALAQEVSILLGPGVNMKRSPLCGRNFEYFSEDPYLAGYLAASFIRGVQELGVGTSLKHFAVNNQETNRMTANSQVDDRALREIYLRAFEIAVKASQPATIMASYNRINGNYACESKWLLDDILRGEWGYQGLVVSDWSACTDLPGSVDAGMDLEMPDSCGNHIPFLRKALEEGTLTQEALDKAAHRVYDMVKNYVPVTLDAEAAAGRMTPDDPRVTAAVAENHALAKEVALGSAVLLKNNGALPLQAGADVVIIGALAQTVRYQGGGSSHITVAAAPSVLESLEKLGVSVTFAPGYPVEKVECDAALEAAALQLVKESEGKPLLFFGGLTDIMEGEGYDRPTMEMPENQKRLLEKVAELRDDIIYISYGGSPYVIPCYDKLQAILHMYLAGEASGEAAADLIMGVVSPSGKLAETWPLCYEDVPCSELYATGSDDLQYRESIYMGYRYYDVFHPAVRFPFGFGLSYTTFEYSNMEYDREKGTVTLDVTNTGSVAGKEAVQIYMENPSGDFIRAKKELRGFTKVEVAPGETVKATIVLDDRCFEVYDKNLGDYITVPGQYRILAAASSQDIRLAQGFTVEADFPRIEGYSPIYIRGERKELSDYFKYDGKLNVSEEQFALLYGKPFSHFDAAAVKGSYTMRSSLRKLSKACLLGKIIYKVAMKEVAKLNPSVDRDDPQYRMMEETIADGTLDLVVCQGGGALPWHVAEAIVLSANGHKWQSFKKLISK